MERIERDRKRADNVGVERILACLGRNLFRRGLNVKWLRAVLGLHDNGVSSEFRGEMGTNLRTYLEDRRLETACWLLVKTDLQVGEIGKRVGYRTLSTFSHAFERRLGFRSTATPSALPHAPIGRLARSPQQRRGPR